MTRPKSIRLFELFYLGSVLVGAINTAMTWAENAASAEAIQVRQMLGPWFLPLSTVFLYTLWLLLWYFTARQRSNVARWVVVVFYALALIGFVFTLAVGATPAGLPLALSAVSLVLTTVAVIFLFRRDAAEWFGKSA
ncbi:MAG: hypothetical protein ACTHJR_15275 [Sphingomonas sp.]|uniref:hypothetical protein n=1 Tax=Sphingomonas sp. TaxID=28214 RepID=UPI003F80ADA9